MSDPEPILVPPEVLGETLGVIQRRRGRAVAREIWSHLRTLPHLRFADTSDHGRVRPLFERDGADLTWVDSCVVAWARKLGCAALCFDPDITRAVPPST